MTGITNLALTFILSNSLIDRYKLTNNGKTYKEILMYMGIQ
ncbi:hypothetical protein [Olivibacter ginsenosidimutans]